MPHQDKELSPKLVRLWPRASTYTGKIGQQILSLSSSNEERAGVRSQSYLISSCAVQAWSSRWAHRLPACGTWLPNDERRERCLRQI